MLAHHRALAFVTLASLVLAAACGDKGQIVNVVTPPERTSAAVRFVNVTVKSTISVVNHRLEGPTDSVAVAPGTFTPCVSVDNNSSFLIANTATGQAYGNFDPGFESGVSYTAIAFSRSDGTTQFLTVVDDFTPPLGTAGGVFVNASAASGDLVILADGSPIDDDGVGPGTLGSFFSLTAGSHAIAFNTGDHTPVVADGGTLNFSAGQNTAVILAPGSPQAGFNVLSVPAC